MLNRYVVGTKVRVQGTFTDDTDAAADPDVVRLKYRAPGDTVTTTKVYGTDSEVQKSGTGVYYADLDTTDAAGVWRYRWESTGAGQAADEEQFFVDGSEV